MITLLFSIIFTIFACGVLSYISMATPIGPWIETTIVLLGMLVFRLFLRTVAEREKALSFSTVAAGIGGIVATALGFSFPTLYFLSPTLFNEWLQTPWYFCGVVGGLIVAAGSFGFLIATMLEQTMFKDPAMVFSVGQMVHKMIAAQHEIAKAFNLVVGIGTSIVYSICQSMLKIIPAHFTVLPKIKLSFITIPTIAITMETLPLYVAIGFVTGHVLAMPLAVGIVSKVFLVETLHKYLFSYLSSSDFILAFGSGMVLQGALLSLKDIPKIIASTTKQLKQRSDSSLVKLFDHISWVEVICVASVCLVFLWYFNFSLLSQLYLLLFTAVCIYQILLIAGKIGIAPLGRYATFVTIPGLLLFKYNAVQITLVATFVEIACGVAADSLFGRKMATLGHIHHKKIVVYQWLGLIVSAASCGIIFWLLIQHFGLGSSDLIVIRAQSRALLVQAFHFDYVVILLGILFGFLLTLIKVNPVLVIGGLLMPVDTSLQLLVGGMMTYLVADKEKYYPFWSGVFATSSLWMILKTLF